MIAPGNLIRFRYPGSVALWPSPGPDGFAWARAHAWKDERCIVVASRVSRLGLGNYDIFVLTSSGALGWSTQGAKHIEVFSP